MQSYWRNMPSNENLNTKEKNASIVAPDFKDSEERWKPLQDVLEVRFLLATSTAALKILL